MRWLITATMAVALSLAGAGCRNLLTGPSDVDLNGTPGEATILEPGWSRPVRLEMSDEGFEDTPYITRDGKFILFFYHPARDILTDPKAATSLQLDGRIYISPRPFTSKTLYPVSSTDPVSEAGPYFSVGGSFFYYRTFPFTTQPNRIVRDGTLLDLGTGGLQTDPCFCDAQNELYFTSNGEGSNGNRSVYVFKNGRATRLGEPINLPNTENINAFLTDDCQTMYFASTRASAPFPRVFRSRRQGEFQWGAPEMFLTRASGGVGQMTIGGNGREMTFIELRQEGGGFTTDVFYSRR
jgi:hypothetical protein